MTDGEIETILAGLPGWTKCQNRPAIERHIIFNDFNEAFAFMTAVAHKAEQMDHHPEWSNIYNRVDIALTTHSEGGVTDKDAQLASFINDLLKDILLS